MKRKSLSLLLAAAMAATMLAGCGSKDPMANMSDEEKAAWEAAANDPYGKYPETVVYTTGYNLTNQGADTLAGTPYENDTPSDNAYTRYLKEVLNVQNENEFEAITGPDYDQKVSMAIASQDIPDIMYISDYGTLVELVENDLIEDLTDVYNNLACETVKSSYASYGEDNNPLNTVTFDGRIMAIPKTQLSDGQDFLWLRKDWMDKLELEMPSTLDEMADVLRAFISQDPDGNGQADTIGLVVHNEVYGSYPNNTFAVDNIFTAFGAYPTVWMTDESGNAVYGSVQPEMKDALQLMRDWYAEGLLDREFTTRTYDDIVALLSSGQCGAYIGPWWSPFNPAQTSTYASQDAEWINVSAPTGPDGKINAINTKSYGGFVVVRKGYEHPEIAMKIVNVNSEYSMQDKSDAAKEILENQSIAYFNWPLYCQVQPGNNAELMTQHVEAVMNGSADVSTLSTEELGYYESAVRYQDAEAAGQKADSADYSQYVSRIVAMNRMIDEPASFLTPAFFETTDTMKTRWASLEKIEMQAILKIIVGEEDLDYFDQFVSEWTGAGGDIITEEVNEAIRQ
ncbi:MAG TPA: extracellular solute-binding protein [Candidatus Eisenbergiella merdigallinarum]|uniref:Extracellular solute-binding protein n=1 Tax=Candidatus Eisenbergiella merdigallinarum TaxID=2838552 RepID=A0A9D2MQN2_9FIRM|nr:extracellular solute-binding protein [Candidatus Eisenbergiella merdigallinarum]